MTQAVTQGGMISSPCAGVRNLRRSFYIYIGAGEYDKLLYHVTILERGIAHMHVGPGFHRDGVVLLFEILSGNSVYSREGSMPRIAGFRTKTMQRRALVGLFRTPAHARSF